MSARHYAFSLRLDYPPKTVGLNHAIAPHHSHAHNILVRRALKIGAGWALFFLSLLPPCAPAASDSSPQQEYVIKIWGADDGLTEGSVTDIAQTPEGYLWIGTLFGSVLRFDGTRFVSYNSANAPEFFQKWGVPRLMVDQQGTLWISMYDGGMT